MRWSWQQPDWPDFSWDEARWSEAEERFLLGGGQSLGTVKHLAAEDRDQFAVEARQAVVWQLSSSRISRTSSAGVAAVGTWVNWKGMACGLRAGWGLFASAERQHVKQSSSRKTQNPLDTCGGRGVCCLK